MKLKPIRYVCFIFLLHLMGLPDSCLAKDLRQSGNEFLPNEFVQLANDISLNPISLWLDRGHEIWDSQCHACHESLDSLSDAVVHFPMWKGDRLVNLEDQIKSCFTKSGKDVTSLEDFDLLAIDALISQSAKGKVIDLKPPTDRTEAQHWQEELDLGASIYTQRQGRINLACTQCHDKNIAKHLRSDVISPAYVTGFPIYRQTWQTMGSIDRRLRACYSGVQAQMPPPGSRELRALELFLKNRSNGMTWDGPSIRR